MGGRLAGVPVLAGAVLALALGTTHEGDRGDAQARTHDVPLAARAAGSAAIGRDDARFHARPARGGKAALRTPGHGLRARIGRDGVALAGGPHLALRGVGRDGAVRPARGGRVRRAANRVEVRRDGVDEWYVNGPLGLEQGFTVRRRPRGTGALDLALGVRGGRVGALDEDRRGTRIGRLAYRGLWAADARGRELRAWMEREAGGRGLRLRVDDRGAAYPLLVDPVFQQSRLQTSDGGPLSGSVAADGDTVVFGALLGGATKGAAYVFERPAGGWSPTQQESAVLLAPDGVSGDQLGRSVAISGATIVVGAPMADIGAVQEQGALYVFERPAGGWSGTPAPAQKLLAADGVAKDQLGTAVSLRGDHLVAGASEHANKLGAAYVFHRSGGAWSQAAELIPAGTRFGNDQLGFSAAMGDGFAAVGTLNLGNAQTGSVWIFPAPAGGWGSTATVTSTQRLQAFDGITGRQFGRAVAVDGHTLVAGADDSGNGGRGAAYVFEGGPGGFAHRAKLTAGDATSGDQLGSAVAVRGDRVAVGAVRDDIGSNDAQGSVYLFRRPAGGWSGTLTQAAKVFPGDGASRDFLGAGVAFSGAAIVAAGTTGTTPRGAWVFGEDDSAPRTTIALRGTTGTEGWFRGPVTIDVSADDGRDGAGAVTTRCALDLTPAPAVFGELPVGCAAGRSSVVAGEGPHVVHAASHDGVGNVEPVQSRAFRIDSTPPVVRCGAIRTFVRGSQGGQVPATVDDALSGPASAVAHAGASTAKAGAFKALVTGADRAGNTATADCAYDVVPAVLPFCGEREVVLVGTEEIRSRVRSRGRSGGRSGRRSGRSARGRSSVRVRVRVRGIARPHRRGETVSILRGGRVVATARVARDGRFSALVAKPSRRTTYVATLGEDRSSGMAHDPRLAVSKRRKVRRGAVLSGRARGRRVTVLRRTGCSKAVRVRTVRVRRGRFSVRLRSALVDVAQFDLVVGKRRVRVAVD